MTYTERQYASLVEEIMTILSINYTVDVARAMIEALHKHECAVAIWLPEELGDVSATHVEDAAIAAGNDHIAETNR